MTSWLGKHWRWLWVAFAVALGLALYGRGLGVPFYMDDLPQIPWVDAQSWSDLWTRGHFFQTYRPVVYSIWKLFVTVQGNYAPLPLKIFSLAIFIADGLLAGRVAAFWWRCEGDRERQIVTFGATALVMAFPFSYQSIPWPASLFHQLIMGYALAAVLCYHQWRLGRGREWLVPVFLLLWLAPFTHELGYLIGPLLFLTELRGRGFGEYKGTWARTAALFAVLAAGVTGFYLLRPHIPGVISAGDFDLSSPENFFQNGSFWLQSLTYPTAPISGALTHRAGINDMVALWLIALPTLIALVWLLRKRHPAAWLTALAWPAVAASTIILFTDFIFLIDAPRQFLFASPGIALIWAGALLEASRVEVPRLTRGALAAILLALAIIPAAIFIRGNMDHLAMLGEVLDDIAAAGEDAHARDKPPLFVNLPGWIAHNPPAYAVAHVGTQLFDDGLFHSHEVIAITSGKEIASRDVAFTNILPLMPYYYDTRTRGTPPAELNWDQMAEAIREHGDVYVTQYAPDRIYLLKAGRVRPASPTTWTTCACKGDPERRPPPALAEFGIHAQITEVEPITAKERPGVRIKWQMLAPEGVEVFVHLYDDDGALISQADGPFLMGTYPVWQVRIGESLEDFRYFAPGAPDSGTVGIGLYDPATGERIPVTDVNGEPLPDDMLRVTF
jgi:hypothetical protein